jgi:AsmA protein
MKKLWMIVAGFLALLLLAVFALPFVIDANYFRPTIESRLQGALGRQVKIGNLSLSAFRGHLSAADISISDDPAFSSQPFVQAESLDVGIELIPLILSRDLRIRSITLRRPELVLLRSADGTWNFSSLGRGSVRKAQPTDEEPSGASAFSVQRLSITDGRMSVGTSAKNVQTYEDVNLTAENVSFTQSFPFSLRASAPRGGALQVEGRAGPVDSRDTTRTPLEAKLTLRGVDIASTGFVDPSSGFAGTLDTESEVRSDGAKAQAKGSATLTGARLVAAGSPATQPISLDYSAAYDLVKRTGELTNGQLTTGKSTLSASGTFDMQGASPAVNVKVSAPSIPVADIQALLPAIGMSLPAGSSLSEGNAKANLSLEGPIDRLVTAGNVEMSNARISGFGLASKMAALSAFTGLKASPDTLIQLMTTNLRVAPEGIRVDGVQIVVPNLGSLSGSGTIDGKKALNFRMVANMAEGGGIANLAARAGLGGVAGRGIPFLVQGTTEQPRFLPDARGMVRSGVSNLVSPPQGSGEGKSLGDVFGEILGTQRKPQ